MNNNLWTLISITVIVLLIMNPESFVLAAFSDAVSLETFFFLREIQVLALAGFVIHRTIKPTALLINQLFNIHRLYHAPFPVLSFCIGYY